jgi:hypothetical protein
MACLDRAVLEHQQVPAHVATREWKHCSNCAFEMESMDDCFVTLPFANRAEAGRLLGRHLQANCLPEPFVVMARRRGSVPVAAHAARCMDAPVQN